MKKLLFPILLISVSLSAQAKKELKSLTPQIDTLHKKNNLFKDTVRPMDQQRSLDRMPVAKPSSGTEYSSLKDTKNDQTDYKMLNSMTPEGSKKEKADSLFKPKSK